MKKYMPSKLNGFTLIEVTVVVFVFAVIASGVIMLVSSVLTNSQNQELQMYNASQARRLSFLIMEELREATQSNVGAYPLATSNSQELTFYSNIDGGLDIERVRYFIQSGKLNRGVVKPTGSPLIYNMLTERVAQIQGDVANIGTDPLFYYYDSAYDGTADTFLPQPVDTTDVRYVKMNLKIYNRAGSANASTYTISTAGTLRNLKTNLDD